MKQILAFVIGVALLVDVSLFVGLGFGFGALSVTGSNNLQTCNSSDQYCWTMSPGWASPDKQQGIQINIESSVQQGANPITTMLSGDQSTSVSFGMYAQLSPYDACPRSGAWQGGYEAWWVIVWPQSVSGSIDGTQFTGSTWSGQNLAQNDSISAGLADLVGCQAGTGYNDNGPTGNLYTQTVTLTGLYPVMTMNLYFGTYGQWCDKYAGSVTNQCYGLSQAITETYGAGTGNNGGWNAEASASFVWQSAQASFQFVDPQNNYNGGTLTAIFYTAYNGANGYKFSIDTPSERPNGGQLDTNFANNPMTIPNFCTTGCEYKWAIPKTLDTNLSGHDVQWDLWSGVLSASTVAEQITQFTVINPLYAPTTPVVTYTSSGAGIYPAVGDTVTLTVYSNASQDSGMVQSIDVEVYYLSPGQGVSSAPSCGSAPAWVTPCPNGQILVVTHDGKNAVGTYTFKVNPPIGDTAIAVAAVSASNISPSLFGYQLISIKASDCAPGATCDPLQSGVTTWEIIGPILLMGAFILGAVLLVLLVPIPPWVRFALPIAVVAILILLYALGWITGLFVPGGAFNSAVA